jgi:antirestriction protein ArdC
MAQHDRSESFAPDRPSLYDEITQEIVRELGQGAGAQGWATPLQNEHHGMSGFRCAKY